ncbi:MAG: LPS export ABC transporter periplasmic protein LptC [Rikenellaceae bacterium]
MVALLILWSATMLLSCQEHKVASVKVSLETLMSESSDSLTVVVSENGRPSYRFFAPLVEGYTLAREPYREFRKGVNIITYLDDSLRSVDATLRSNYAIYYPNLKLWEAKGDVVVVKHNGKELYTQQLFWNSLTKRIYSNVDTKIVDTASGDLYNGEGFESDEEMKVWSFRKMKGTMRVDVSPTPVDSTAVDTPKNESAVVENKSVPQATAAREEADAKQVVRDREHDERMLKLREERGAREQLPKDEREKLMRELPPRDSAVGQKVRPRE